MVVISLGVVVIAATLGVVYLTILAKGPTYLMFSRPSAPPQSAHLRGCLPSHQRHRAERVPCNVEVASGTYQVRIDLGNGAGMKGQFSLK